MSTAILVDAAFFIKRFRTLEPHNAYNAKRAADLVCRYALLHLKQKHRLKSSTSSDGYYEHRDLYRILVYDCSPISKKLHHPLTNKCIDFSKSREAIFRNEFHAALRKKRKVALRLGILSGDVSFTLKPSFINDLLKNKREYDSVTENDITISTRQKGVDMRMGVDITTLSLKKLVKQIVLFTGDSDFVPASKLARREGIDVILDPMWLKIHDSLHEHIDGLKSVCNKIQRNSKSKVKSVKKENNK